MRAPLRTTSFRTAQIPAEQQWHLAARDTTCFCSMLPRRKACTSQRRHHSPCKPYQRRARWHCLQRRALALVVVGAEGGDLNGDGNVNAADLAIMLANWG